MNQDVLYQNREISEPNPFTDTIPPVKNKLSLPSHPKIKILLILGIFIVLIFMVNIFISLSQKTAFPAGSVTPTPTTISTPQPTEIPNSAIPAELQSQFDQIDKSNQTDINFPPPQIDSKIGST
jgi:hypothetical protein